MTFKSDPGTFVHLLFMTCPLVMVGFGLGRSRLVHADQKNGWKRFLLSWSMVLGLLQVGVLVMLIVQDGGVVPLRQNVMVGPRWVICDQWGAKNAAKIKFLHEWYRLLSPVMLHMGWIHVISNLVVQLSLGIMLEVTWGHCVWLVVYMMTGAYGSLGSCVMLPNKLGVGSSGAICGIMGAWPAFVACTWNQTMPVDRGRRNSQFLMGVGSLLVLGTMSFIPLLDWAAHVGGAVMGLALGAGIFGFKLQDTWYRVCTVSCGISFVVLLWSVSLGLFFTVTDPTEDLLDICSFVEC